MLMDTVVISSNSEGASKAMIALACDGSQVQQPLIRLAGHRHDALRGGASAFRRGSGLSPASVRLRRPNPEEIPRRESRIYDCPHYDTSSAVHSRSSSWSPPDT